MLLSSFHQVSQNWPCVYFNDTTKMLLVVYVDDLKLAGPREHMASSWEALGKGINLEEPKGNEPGVHTFLGCTHTRSPQVLFGKNITVMEYSVEGAMKRALQKYSESFQHITGKEPIFKKVVSP